MADTLAALPAHLRALADAAVPLCTTGRPDPTLTAAHARAKALRETAELAERLIAAGCPWCGEDLAGDDPDVRVVTLAVDRSVL